MIHHMIYSLYLEVDWPLRWEWVRFPLMNSGVSDTFDLGSTTAITSCVLDPSQVAGDLSTRPEFPTLQNLYEGDMCKYRKY